MLHTGQLTESYAHRVGQIIGDLLEVAIKPFLDEFAQRHQLYLDVKGNRLVRGKGKNLTWVDGQGNKHNLDFVLGRGGRRIDQVHVLPLHSSASVLGTVAEALDFTATYQEAAGSNVFTRYEIIVRFNNGSEIIGTLTSKAEALEFLAAYV